MEFKFLLKESNLVSSLMLLWSEFQSLIASGKNEFCLCSNLAEICLKFDLPPWVCRSKVLVGINTNQVIFYFEE